MPEPLRVTIPHKLGRTQARARIDANLGKLHAQLAPLGATAETSWQGDRLDFTVRAFAQRIGGRIFVFDESVRVEVDLPVFLALLANKIAGRVEKQGRLLLGPPTKT